MKNKKQTKIDNQDFYKKVLILVLPMALQNLINVGVSAADIIMLGKVGETALSGASLAGQVQWVMTLIFFGISSGASVLTAQYWGKRDITAIEKVLGIALRISLCISLGFFLAALFLPSQLLLIFTKEPEVAAAGAEYLAIIKYSYLIMGFTVIYLSVIKSIERVIISTVVYSITLVVNVILNYILIFGRLGFAPMGIEGAAMATLLSRVVELLLVLFYSIRVNGDVKVRITYLLRQKKEDSLLWKDYMVYSIPVILNELMWGAGYSANAAIIGRLGKSVVAANAVAQMTRQLATVVSFGIASAAAIMIGKAIGEKKEEAAEAYSQKFIKLSLIAGAAGGLLIFLIRPLIVTVMGLSGETVRHMNVFMLIISYYVICQAFNSALIVGIFRAGGDTRFGLVLDVLTMWLGSILLGAAAAFLLKLPVYLVFMLLMSDEVLKLPFSYRRYRTKKWLRNVTREAIIENGKKGKAISAD